MRSSLGNGAGARHIAPSRKSFRGILARLGVMLLPLASFAFLTGCATKSSGADLSAAPPAFLLLGEVHDNPDAHARRFQDLKARVEQGWRPAIAMEQFDLDRTADLERAQAECPDADCIINRVRSGRWNWPYYRPVLALALQYKLPIVAANLSRQQAMRVAREGLDAALPPAWRKVYGGDEAVDPRLAALQQAEVKQGHCGKASDGIVPGLALVQIARDIGMAQAMISQENRGVVLLAGNGHVRKDIGVPYWLRRLHKHDVYAVAYVEKTQDAAGLYDVQIQVPAFSRADPCEGLKM